MRRVNRIPVSACLGVALALSAAQVIPAQAGTAATQSLLDKAHALEVRGRLDMAAQTWQQVLLADPRNTAALGGLARAAKSAGNNALADTYMERLRAINPNDPEIAKAQAVVAQATQSSQLQQAGKLAEHGNYAQAMALYRQVYGAQPPAGDWGLAYYETEAATEDGRAHAIAGLRAFAEKYPQDSRYIIALGRILTYNPKTRAEGRRYLEKYPNSADAAAALRQSLVWDSANPASAADIRAYLQRHRDSQLEGALQQTTSRASAAARNRPSGPVVHESKEEQQARRVRDAEEAAAYASLNGKRFQDADTRFRALLLKDPQNARALAGLGYVRMNQQDFGGAVSFLEQAKRDGATDKGLDHSLETARFFYLLSQGGVALDDNDLPTAEQDYRDALKMRPTAPEALQGLGGTLLKAGEAQASVPYFQQLLKVKPSAAAWRSLFLAQYQAGDPATALATDGRVPTAIKTQLLRDPEYLRTLASAYTAAGRDADAQRVLQTALNLPFPQEARGVKADTQLQYASLLLQANRTEQASGLYRQVLADDPSNALAWQGLVNAEHAMHDDALALQTLESMPPGVYDQVLRDPGFLSASAAIYQSNNKFDLAQALLERAIAARNTTGQTVPEALQLQLAGLYLQRNDPSRAFPIYQRVLTANPERVDGWRGLLTSLHLANRDREALAEIQQIPPAVRKQLEQNVDYLQTVGQIYNGLGQPRQAMLFLNRVQQHYAAQHAQPPADIDIQNAWLLYNGNNDTGLYRQLLVLGARTDLSDDQRRTVQTIWANWAVRRAGQASAAGSPKRGLAILNAAAHAFPDNPAVLRALASGYQRAGLAKEAVAIFKAQDMSSASASDYKAAVGAAIAAPDLKQAELWLRYGLNQFPRDSDMLTLAAKFEQARGDSGRAADYYKASLSAMPPPDPGSELAAALSSPAPLNPRPLPTAAQPQDLASMLAPGAEGPVSAYVAEKERPYLPSATNDYGTAPVQIGNSTAGDGSTRLVPQYMRNPASGRSAATGSGTRSTLGTYRPPSPSGSDLYPDGAPAGTYVPPTTANPGTVQPLPAYPGVSVNDIPAEASPAEDAAVYLAVQQEQVRRANEVAASSDPVATLTGGLGMGAPDATAANPMPPRDPASNGEVFGAYVPYVAPTQQGGTPTISYNASPVDLPTQTIITEFPTATGKLVPLHNARANRPAKPRHTQDEIAEAAAIRRRQSEPEIVQGTADPEAVDDLTDAVQAQYGGNPTSSYSGSLSPAPGQSRQTSRLPATAPTNTLPLDGVASGLPTRQTRTVPSDSTTTTVTADFPRDGATGNSYGQQYPQPVRSTARIARRRPVRRQAAAVTAFGPGAPPVFYPGVPSALSSQPYPDLPPYNNGQQPPTDAQLVARNVPPLRGSYDLADANGVAGPPLTPRQQTELDLAQLEESYSGWLGGNAWVRTRSGDPGINRLYDFEVPFEASVVVGKTVRFTVVPKGVFLNSGTVDNTRYTSSTFAPYLGSLSAASSNTPSPQYASGIGGELQMSTVNLGIAIGYTPYQFLVGNITGRFRYRPAGGPFSFYGEREPVKDTQLSYSGLRDPGSITFNNLGNIWGGVVATGGGVRLDKGNERAGLYAGVDYAAITGYHVLENRRVEGTGGAYFRVHTFPNVGTLNIGASLFGMHYDYNERATSYGLGGYFSPNVYFLGSVPLTLTGHYKTAWHYVAQAAVGLQTFQESNDPYFPLPEDAALQASARQGCSVLSLQQRNCATAYQPLNTSTGANFSLNLEGAYRVADHWYAGGAIAANNTNNYNVVQPTLFVRYLFKPQYPTEDYPTGLFPTEGLRPLRVP